jgi:hypothetical protein
MGQPISDINQLEYLVGFYLSGKSVIQFTDLLANLNDALSAELEQNPQDLDRVEQIQKLILRLNGSEGLGKKKSIVMA